MQREWKELQAVIVSAWTFPTQSVCMVMVHTWVGKGHMPMSKVPLAEINKHAHLQRRGQDD